MNSEECALWDRIVADYLDSPHGKEISRPSSFPVKGKVRPSAPRRRSKGQ